MADKKSVSLPEGILLALGRLKGGYPAVSEANPDYQSESRGDVVSVSGVGTCGAGSIDLSILRRRSHEILYYEGADF